MNKPRSIIKKRKKKGVSILRLFIILVSGVGFVGIYLSSKVVSRGFAQEKANTDKTTVATQRVGSTSSGNEEIGKIPNYSSGVQLTRNGFVKIDHALEGAKLKKSNEPGHLQFSILQASYESKGHYITDNLWQDILNKGVGIMEKNNYAENLVVIEVGAHRAKQSIDAAKLKYHAYCIEPSPKSFEMMFTLTGFKINKEPHLGHYIHLLNMAAGSETGKMLEFKSAGSTGDHVGNFDMWNMRAGKDQNKGIPSSKIGNIVKVPSLKLDDLIYNRGNFIKQINVVKNGRNGANPPPIDEVFAIKIDTQGYEPEVFSGLDESIENNKIKYILFEYWPNGMALINDRTDKCEFATQILTKLVSAGYTLYALPVLFHPSIRLKEVHYGVTRWFERPFDDYKADCEYLLNMEKKFDLGDYKAGFWTDYLAIAPGVDPIEAKAFGYV